MVSMESRKQWLQEDVTGGGIMMDVVEMLENDVSVVEAGDVKVRTGRTLSLYLSGGTG